MTSLLAALHGSRTPRVSKYPRGVSSAGQEAVELAASAGLILDPWQADVLEAALQEGHDGRWAAFEVGVIVPRQNGKGSILEARELAGLFLFGERMIVHTSHEFKTTAEAFRRIRTLIESTPDLDRKVKNYWMTTGREGIELKTGAQLRFLARSKGSGRGFSGDLVVLDEAFALEDTMVEALLPTLSARPNPQLWYTSSPPLDGFTGEPLYALRKRGESPAPSDGLCWLDWGAEMGADPDDRRIWAATNPALGHRITEEFIARERAAMAPEGFARERLGVWPRSADAAWVVIPRAEWEAARWPDMPRPEPIALAVTVSEDQAWSAICAAGRVGERESDGRPLYGVVVIDRRPGIGWTAERLFELADRWDPVITICDRNSPANEVWAEVENANLARLGSAEVKQLELTPISARDVQAAAAGLFTGIAGVPTVDDTTGELVNPRNVRHHDQDDLNRAIAGATKLSSPSGSWRFDPLGDPVAQGCANALWGFKSRPEPVAEPWAFSA